jgi:hypothetical protein
VGTISIESSGQVEAEEEVTRQRNSPGVRGCCASRSSQK